MAPDELMNEACRLAIESVRNAWGGPFGAVIARGGEIVAQGQNRVLLTGDVTAHAEIEAIRKAVQVLNPEAPTIAVEHRNQSTLAMVPAPEGTQDRFPQRARMLVGMEMYTTGMPCLMCMSAIYWARLDAAYFASDLAATRSLGFDDAIQYEDFTKPFTERSVKIEQLRPDLGAAAYAAWSDNPDNHPF
ncbi:nucleoside deaminase [Rhodococcus spongiicola]|uniref:Nucleoside deaminase n=1 Tax=Rhodococcus spongiicola TaxID=2487352 RepID=A0A3S3ZLY6_9NOCA|nr:nucleoside deaminase [Rhodococcus spongiicola]